MRTIKFRAWDTGTKNHPTIMHKWAYLSGAPFNSWEPRWVVMQFTGLHDKNGKEIYEGDIVRVDDFAWEIVFDWSSDGEYGWCQKRIGHKVEKIAIIAKIDGISDRYEIIGNVYENPELLEESTP